MYYTEYFVPYAELLTLFAERDLLKRMYQKVLLSSVLYAYLALRRLILLRTKPLDQTQSSLLKLLEMLATGISVHTYSYIVHVLICIRRSCDRTFQHRVYENGSIWRQ